MTGRPCTDVSTGNRGKRHETRGRLGADTLAVMQMITSDPFRDFPSIEFIVQLLSAMAKPMRHYGKNP